MQGRFIFDDRLTYTPAPFFQTVPKTANYTVVAGADNGTHFTTTGNAGAITFTLPAVAKGNRFRFTNTVGQAMTITAPANTLVAPEQRRGHERRLPDGRAVHRLLLRDRRRRHRHQVGPADAVAQRRHDFLSRGLNGDRPRRTHHADADVRGHPARGHARQLPQPARRRGFHSQPVPAGHVQRRSHISSTLTYGPDRFFFKGGASSSIDWSQVADASIAGFADSLKWQRTLSNTDTASLNLGRSWSPQTRIRTQGQQVTLSFWAKQGVNYSGGPDGCR